MTIRSSAARAVLAAAALVFVTAAAPAQDAPGIAPSAIGDAARDLSFSPVPRCRLLDTRVEGGRLSAGVPRHFDVADSLSGQGGSADCLVPLGATVVLIRVAPVQPQGPGTLSTWAFGGATANGTAVKFSPGSRGTRPVIPDVLLPICNPATASCSHDITIRADGSDTDVIADVAGYFAAPAAPWSAVGSKPAGFADDMDNDVLGGLACANNQVAKRVGSAWACTADNDTTYGVAVNGGLSLSGSNVLSIASLAIGSSMLANDAITNTKIAADAVGASEIAADAVGASEIAGGAVGRAEISGTEVVVYQRAVYFTCAGACGAGAAQTCSNTPVGYLLSPSGS